MNTGRNRLAEPQITRNGRTPFATGCDQFGRNGFTVTGNIQQPLEALGHTGIAPGMLQQKTDDLRQTAVDPFEITFEAKIIGAVQLTDACGVAAAAQILQQEGVIEFPACALVQLQLIRQMHADPAAAHAMSRRLTLGHVQRVRQCTDQLGKTHTGAVVQLPTFHILSRDEACRSLYADTQRLHQLV